MPTSKLPSTNLVEKPEYIPLKDFLKASSLSYTIYRNLRLAGKTPPEYKLSGKVILLKATDVAQWWEEHRQAIKPIKPSRKVQSPSSISPPSKVPRKKSRAATLARQA